MKTYKDYKVYELRTREERMMAYKFRYKVYVEQMNRAGVKADHINKMITDEFDTPDSTLFGVFSKGELIGTGRANTIKKGIIAPQNNVFNFSYYNYLFDENYCYVSKLMVDQSRHLKVIGPLIVRELYRHCLRLKAQNTIIDCNDYLLKYYKKLGFIEIRKTQHPEFGKVSVMLLQNFNHIYLKAINSPFYREFVAHIEKIKTVKEELNYEYV